MPLLSNSRTPFRAASLIGLLFLSARHVSAASDNTDIAGAASWQVADSVAGFKLLYGEPVTLEKRQSTCASNGSNYCFGDSVSFCSSCGLCCGSSSSGYCCGAAQVCCGTACCASGQTCSDGKCLAELATVTVTDAAFTTVVSHVATEMVTVEQAVVSTSTIFSTVEITVSSGGTQTDIQYVTVTAATPTKRTVVVEVLEPREEGILGALHLFFKRFSFPGTSSIDSRWAPVERRAEKPTGTVNAAASSPTTVTTRITQTRDVTNFVSQTTTVPTTSVALITIFQTKTKVLDAQTTITTTSTLTITPNQPTTETITKTATRSRTSDSSSAPTSSSTDPATPSTPATASSSGLSKGAIAGIGGGIGGAAALAILALALWWYRRRRARGPPHQDPSSYLEPYIPDMSSPLPPARTDRFGPAAPHHADSAAGLVGAAGAPKSPTNLNRYSNISGGPGKKPVSPRMPDMAEMGGEVYEADGTSRRPAPGPVYEADSGQPASAANPPYPTDAGEVGGTPTRGHRRDISGSSGGRGYGELDGSSPVQEAGDGSAGERIRNTNPYRTPGAYRDF